MSREDRQCDVLVVGGGLVGSTLAHALGQAGVETVLVEERDPGVLEQPSFDDRVTALANGSQRILRGLDLWSALIPAAEPIRSIHISQSGHFGASRILAAEEGVGALGYTVENRRLGGVVWPRLLEARFVTCRAPARLDTLTIDEAGVRAGIASNGRSSEIRAQLVVAADGARSRVRGLLGVRALEDAYEQKAVAVNCETEVAPQGRAFERFMPRGPLAFLPMSDARAAVVWTLDPAEADRVMGLEDRAFRQELQRAFGYRLGRIRRTGARAAYPLARVRSVAVTADRAVMVGNAAVSLHPVAGQGFNLALRDIAALAETLGDARRADGSADLGAASLLAAYRDWRNRDHRRVAAFTHGLVRLFGYGTGPLAMTRGLGLVAFDLLPGAKGRFARRTMGLTGRLPRLARGLPLVP